MASHTGNLLCCPCLHRILMMAPLILFLIYSFFFCQFAAYTCIIHVSFSVYFLLLISKPFLFFIQNDLVHGWGVDMKVGYCAQVRFTWCYFGPALALVDYSFFIVHFPFHSNIYFFRQLRNIIFVMDIMLFFRVIVQRRWVWLIVSTLFIRAYKVWAGVGIPQWGQP